MLPVDHPGAGDSGTDHGAGSKPAAPIVDTAAMAVEEALQTMARMNAAFNSEGWNGLRPFLHPDFEFHEPPEQPGASVFRGPDAAVEGWRGWSEAWVDQQSTPEGIAVLPDGRILLLTRERLRGRDELVMEHRAAQVVTLRDGMVLRWEASWDRDRTLRKLGLTDADVLPL